MQQKREMKILLAESFKELVLKKPAEKITIKEITDLAGVIRVTFYNHFQDKYELLEWICLEEVINPAKVLFQNNMQKEAILFIFSAIIKNRDFYSHVSRLRGQNSFTQIMQKLLSEVVDDYVKDKYKENMTMDSLLLKEKWIPDYYSYGLTFIILQWIEEGMKTPPEEMTEIYLYVSGHSIFWNYFDKKNG